VTNVATNKNKLTRINNKTELINNFSIMTLKFKPVNKEEHLALYVAQALDDIKNLPFYLSCTKSFPEDSVRKALNAVRKEAIVKIKNRRGTFFKYLMQLNAKTTDHNSGN
jgi:hypothetical protein